MPIPTKVADRLRDGLKRLQPVLTAARAKDINESDTSRIVVDVLSDLFGFDKYSEITSEFAIRGTYCDLAIKLDGKLHLLVEVKAVGTELKDSHIKQAVDYGANQGVDWILLTNSVIWRAYRVHYTKPINHELVLQLNLTELSHRNAEHLEQLFLFCREALIRSSLAEYHTQRQALNKFMLAGVILSEPIVAAIRRELRRLTPGVKIEPLEIETALLQEILKREIVEGDKADEARRKINRSLAKATKKAAAEPETVESAPTIKELAED